MKDQINKLIQAANHIVVIQADNPDGDSLASSLALEAIITAMNKKVTMYCAVQVPTYLRYLTGWDRVVDLMPISYDLAIIVDTQSLGLLEQLQQSASYKTFVTKPCVVIDHHATNSTIDFTDYIINDTKAVSTGEVIYELAQQFDWPLDLQAQTMIASSILSDSLGLMTENTSSRSIHIIADLVDFGVDLAKLDNKRKETSRKTEELLKYKGQLLQRIQFHDDNKIATVDISWDEIVTYSPLYNPSMLVMDDMRFSKGTHIAIAFKSYNDGKITAKIRSNYGVKIADKLAEHFGGGGHPYASGFKVQGKQLVDIKKECIIAAIKLLDTLQLDHEDTPVRHTF